MRHCLKNLTIFILSFSIIIPSCYFFYLRFGYNLKFPIVYDAFFYTIIGRGIANGFLPYIDMFDIKPIGIYILHFLSYKLTDTLILSQLFHIFCYTTLFLFPLMFIKFVIKPHQNSMFLYSITIGISSLFITYVDLKGGRLLPELFGVFFSCLYIYFLNTNYYKHHPRLFYIVQGALMSLACNFKEPFLLAILSSCIIFSNTIKDFSRKFIIPFILACIISVSFLLSLKILFPYLEYLYYMIFIHANIDKHTIFQRAFYDINNIFNTLNSYSHFLGSIFLLLLIFPIFNIMCNHYPIKNKIKNSILKSVKQIIVLYIATMGVRTSGIYYYQHNSFAVPFIFSLLLYFLKNINLRKCYHVYYTLFIQIVLIGTIYHYPTLSIIDPSDDMFYDSKLASEAAYIDNVLNKIDEKTYTYIGGMGFHLWGYTKHSPKGKYAVQVDNWNADKLPYFYEDIIENVEEAKLIVFSSYKNEKLKNIIDPILEKKFTTSIPSNLLDITRPQMRYKIYFAKNL